MAAAHAAPSPHMRENRFSTAVDNPGPRGLTIFPSNDTVYPLGSRVPVHLPRPW